MNAQETDYRNLVPVPPEPQPQLEREEVAIRTGNLLYLPSTVSLPVETCICCGKPSKKSVKKAIRNPLDPRTWYSRQRVIEIGLCQKHRDDNLVANTLTYSLLGVGSTLVLVGAMTLHLPTILVGVLVGLFSGVFRARKPISSPDPRAEGVMLKGCAEAYLRQFPDKSALSE